MQPKKDVNAEVLKLIHKRAAPGTPITPQDWRQAYSVYRAIAIADTIFWKQNNITIERA